VQLCPHQNKLTFLIPWNVAVALAVVAFSQASLFGSQGDHDLKLSSAVLVVVASTAGS